VIAVAPLLTYKLPEGEGVTVRDKIAQHMETDLGLKVIRLSQPVSMKDSVDPFDISAGTDNAEKILDEKGADLIIWGTEDMQGDGHQWSVYVSASAHAQCLAREQGFSIHSTTDLDDVGEADLLEVLDWATLCWRGLLDSSQGMYIAKTIEPMVDKIDTVLGLAAEKQMGHQALDSVKRNLAFFLASYGLQTNNVKALNNAIRLAREGVAQAPVNPETHAPMGDMEMESILGKCLFTLGNMQNDPKNLEESVRVDQVSLRQVNPKYDPQNWAVLQCSLGASLAELGKRKADSGMIRQAIQAFNLALEKTDKQLQPNQWLCVQNGLGASYLFLGGRETDTTDLKKAIPHYLEALSNNAETNQPNDYTMVEMNLGVLYFTLGEREKSPEDMRQSVLYCGKAADRFKQMGNNYALGFSLGNLGQAQLRLANYTDDEALLAESQKTLARAQFIVPQSQDETLWSKCQLYLALAEIAQASKAFDRATFQQAWDKLDGLKALYDPQTRRPMYNEISEFQAELDVLMGNLDCNTLRMDRILKALKAMRAVPGFMQKGLTLVQVDELLGKASNLKGMREKNQKLLRQGIAYFEEALATASQGNMDQYICSLKSELASAYANLLLLTPDSDTTSKAKALLLTLEKDCMTSPIVANEANHKLCAAKLERALAKVGKDPTPIQQGRPLSEAGLKLLAEHHYVFWAAVAQEELGDEDQLLALLTGDPTAAKNAVQEYGEADKIYLAMGLCWEKDTQEKLSKARMLAGK
jgi:tetratricopeptide (TPR) repeat protein